MFNISTRKVGGIRFIKIGRLTLSFCVSSSYRPVGASKRRAVTTVDLRMIEVR